VLIRHAACIDVEYLPGADDQCVDVCDGQGALDLFRVRPRDPARAWMAAHVDQDVDVVSGEEGCERPRLVSRMPDGEDGLADQGQAAR